jgi:hypothetical protein
MGSDSKFGLVAQTLEAALVPHLDVHQRGDGFVRLAILEGVISV